MGSTKDIEKWNENKLKSLIYDEKDNERYVLEVGKSYNFLSILNYAGKDKHGHPVMLCKCNKCGNEKLINLYTIRTGASKTCGCEQQRKTSESNKTHNLSNSKLYNVYYCMKARCYNPKNNRFHVYGAIGICICDEWLGKDGFINFYKWAINNGYEDGLSIDRKDPYGNYEPDNCRWVSEEDQMRNKKCTMWLEYKGYNFPLSIWADIVKINYKTLFLRYSEGWTSEEILRTPIHSRRGNGFLCWEVSPEYMKYHKSNL